MGVDAYGRVIYNEKKIKYVTDHEGALFLSYARNIIKNISAGTSLKFVYQSIFEHTLTGFSIDLSALI